MGGGGWPTAGMVGACVCGGLAGQREGFTPTPAPVSSCASRSQTDPGLPTESSLLLGPRFLAPPPQLWASLVAQIVKNPPTIQETWARFLGRKDPLEEEMETRDRILA